MNTQSIEHVCRAVATISKDVTLCVWGCYLTYWAAQLALLIVAR